MVTPAVMFPIKRMSWFHFHLQDQRVAVQMFSDRTNWMNVTLNVAQLNNKTPSANCWICLEAPDRTKCFRNWIISRTQKQQLQAETETHFTSTVTSSWRFRCFVLRSIKTDHLHFYGRSLQDWGPVSLLCGHVFSPLHLVAVWAVCRLSPPIISTPTSAAMKGMQQAQGGWII